MLAFSLVASALGATTAFAGFYCAYRLDLPLGPVDVALACSLLVVVGAIGTVRRALMRTRNG